MDRRSDRGEFYPGGDRSGGAPAPQQSDKVDRVNVGEVGESYTLKDVKNKVNQLVRVIAPAAVCLALAVVRLLSYAATAPLEDIPNTAPVVTNEEDAVAIAAVGALGAAVSNRVEAAEGSLQAEITGATNAVVQAALRAAEAESNRVDATYAKRSEIPAAPDLAPYALKSELPQDYLVESDITNFATRAWINSQNYAREGTVYTRLDAQDLAINATSQRVDTVDAALGNRLEAATNRVWQGVRAASNELARTDARLEAKIDALELTGGMTRLWSSDATTYQDATGVVWQVQVVTGLWTVVHSWTTTGMNWQGPRWWGAEGTGEDYYEGPGWYISGSTFTPMRMSEYQYEKEIVWQWSYWDEQEHSITTTCSRTVQWFTNAVNRVAYTNEVAEAIWRLEDEGTVRKAEQLVDTMTGDSVTYWDVKRITTAGNYETVSNRAMRASAYTDAALGAFASTGAVKRAEIYGTPTRWTDATGCVWETSRKWVISPETYTGSSEWWYGMPIVLAETHEAGEWWRPTCLGDSIGSGKGDVDSTSLSWISGEAYIDITASRILVTNLVGRVALTNDIPRTAGDVGAYPAASGSALESGKQDRLPYPTNAIPFSAIDGAPSGGPEWTISVQDSDFIEFVTNGIARVRWWDYSYTDISDMSAWPDGAAMFVRFEKQQTITSWTVGNRIHLVGYGTWPTNNFQSVWWRSGTNIYVNVILEE